MKVKLLAVTPKGRELIAASARLCYSNSDVDDLMKNFKDGEIEAFIQKLSSMGHESPFEHVAFTFSIEGISRATSHQLVRHRLASYSQRSQRYTENLDNEYVIPPEIAKREMLEFIYREHMLEVLKVYRNLARSLHLEYIKEFQPETKEESSKLLKKALEDARYVLPNASKTSLIMTMNARELMHFFEKRCCKRAQWEIQEMAWKLLLICRIELPEIFDYVGPSCIKGKCKEGILTCGKPYKLK